MSGAMEFVENELKREHVRLFHLTGEAASGMEPLLPSVALTPSVLDQIPLPLPAGAPEPIPVLHAKALVAARTPARKAFLDEVRHGRNVLQALCVPDAPLTPEEATAVFGLEGGTFFDMEALAKTLQRPARGTRVIEPHRRARLETALASLDGFLSAATDAPAVWLFNAGSVPVDMGAVGGKAIASGTPLLDGMRFLRHMLDSLKSVLQALRLVRLEAASAYEPSRHDEAIDRMDWQYASPDQLRALPPVLVIETAERLARTSLTELGRVLRSGLPLQIGILSEGMGTRDLSEFTPDLGYLAMAHREAFVMQASLAHAENLKEGLAQMAATLRPAVAIVSGGETPLVHWSRHFPLFRYDPDRGDSWAQRFLLFHELTVDGITPAHAAVMFHEMREHFLLLPPSAWDSEQMELADYLVAWKDAPPPAVPYIWVKDAQGGSHRAVITRELAHLCMDRKRAWHVFEELAGLNNAYVKAAEARVREQMRVAAAANEKVVAETARQEGVRNAVGRLVIALTNPQAGLPSPVAAAPLAPPAPVAAPKTALAPTAPDLPESADPYIDSFLCTSCNDCFKVNPKLFAYDGNKQAYIADAKSGTYAELVKAAEACPAKCIHPGAPRAGDPTATPSLIERGRKL
jgi:ferredoxin